jgi:Asp-tRNA(Asn)/Glu-tRNA(Gln) amidotransferase A subunit family amidase
VIGRDPIPDWIDYSTDGPLGARADDLRILMGVLAGPTPGDPTTAVVTLPEGEPLLGSMVAIERWENFGPLPEETATLFEAALGRLAVVFGAEPRHVTPSELFGGRTIDDEWVTVCAAEHAHLLGTVWVEEHRDDLSPPTRSFLERGTRVTVDEYLTARRRRFEYVRILDELLGSDGVIVSPVMASDALPAEGPSDGRSSEPELYVTTMQNVTGHPALSLPAGAFPSGVPFGLQVTAPRFRDDLLLAIADRWEEAEGAPPSPPGFASFGV